MSGPRDRYSTSAKERRAVDVYAMRARQLVQRETAAYIISKAYYDAGGEPCDSFAGEVVRLAEMESAGRLPASEPIVRHDVRYTATRQP
jgi:hypothetical protein